MTPPLHRKATYCSPQYIQTTPLSHITVSRKAMKAQSLSGPSAGVPKMAITVFTKTPAEHLEAWRWPTVYGPWVLNPHYWRKKLKTWRDGQEFPEWALPDPPTGFIRVKWYSQFERLDCQDGELEANIPLEPTGWLNLTRIENMWGIDRCVPVDPWRMKKFEPGLPHVLSPIAIQCLKDTEGAIRLIEEASESVERLRAVRWRIIRFFRDCEDVPYDMAVLFLMAVFITIRLLSGRGLSLSL